MTFLCIADAEPSPGTDPGTQSRAVSSCVMGMETLNNAARAAGYAMATSDELLSNSKPDETRSEADSWRPGEAIIASKAAPSSSNMLHSVTDWVKGRVLGVFGRGAPA